MTNFDPAAEIEANTAAFRTARKIEEFNARPLSTVAPMKPNANNIKPTGIDAVLAERGTRYGPFSGHAEVTQRLKKVIENHLGNSKTIISNVHQEALDMICHKIGRIVNGDPNYADSWVDIAGYAQLVVDKIEGKQNA